MAEVVEVQVLQAAEPAGTGEVGADRLGVEGEHARIASSLRVIDLKQLR